MTGRGLRRALRWGVLACVIAVVFPIVTILAHRQPASLPADAVIVVLGGGRLEDGSLHPGSIDRVVAAAALHAAGIGRYMLMTSGGATDTLPSVGAQMGQLAQSLGVPADAIRVEDQSYSTLQNAIFTREVLGADAHGPLILVTHRYHVARSRMSYRWAGMDELTLFASDAHISVLGTGYIVPVLKEGIKWPVNLLRAGLASAAMALGVKQETLVSLLR